MSTNRTFKLGSGITIPSVGFGTWKSSPEDAYNSVKTALEIGYRHVDTAWVYGNEPDVGRAIQDSGVKREDIFLTTKLWSTFHSRVEENLDSSLKQLRVDYLDLYLLHWPVALNPAGNPEKFPVLADGTRDLHDYHFTKTWASMEKLLSTGKVRAIGVANFDITNLETLLQTCKITPDINQVELHPYLQQRKLKAYCAAKGIHVTGYSPLGAAGSTVKTEPVILEIAAAHNCDPCTAILAWGLQSGHSVLPKSITPSRIKSNFEEVHLTKEDIAKIDGLEKGGRTCKPEWGVTVFHDSD